MLRRSSLAISFCPRALAKVAQSPECESWADFSQAARCHARSAKAMRRGYSIPSNCARVRIVSVHTWDWIPAVKQTVSLPSIEQYMSKQYKQLIDIEVRHLNR